MRRIAGARAEVEVESRKRSEDATQMSDLTGRRVEPWEVAFFNGAAILDVIPVQSRDHDLEQVAFRGGSFRAPTRRGHRQESEEVSDRTFNEHFLSYQFFTLSFHLCPQALSTWENARLFSKFMYVSASLLRLRSSTCMYFRKSPAQVDANVARKPLARVVANVARPPAGPSSLAMSTYINRNFPPFTAFWGQIVNKCFEQIED